MAMPSLSIDFNQIGDQFRGLRGRHPGLWPAFPRNTMLVAIFAAIMALGYFLYWQGLLEELQIGEARELTLKEEFQAKMKLAVNLDVLRAQKIQVNKYVSELEKQLPGKAEMDALLSDINQAGVGRGLQFELFKPGQVVLKDYYAELPISIRLSGPYHDLGAFTSDVANLSRIVTLSNVAITAPEKGTALVLDAVAKTYRYLDPEEIAAVRRDAAAKAQAAKGGAQ